MIDDPLSSAESVDEDPESSKGASNTKLDRIEQWSKIWVNFGKLALIVAVAVASLLFQKELTKREEVRQREETLREEKAQEEQTKREELRLATATKAELSKPWLEEALKVLREQTTVGEAPTLENPMLGWAMAVFKDSSPVKVDDKVAEQILKGALKFDHVGTDTKYLTWNLELSTTGGPEKGRLRKGVDYFTLNVPDEIKGKKAEEFTVTFRESGTVIKETFEFFDVYQVGMASTREGEPTPGSIIVRYRLREGISHVESIKAMVTAEVEVPGGPVYARPNPHNPTQKIYYGEDGKPVHVSWYGGYDVYDFTDEDLTESERVAAEKKRVEDFDEEWNRKKE